MGHVQRSPSQACGVGQCLLSAALPFLWRQMSHRKVAINDAAAAAPIATPAIAPVLSVVRETSGESEVATVAGARVVREAAELVDIEVVEAELGGVEDRMSAIAEVAVEALIKVLDDAAIDRSSVPGMLHLTKSRVALYPELISRSLLTRLPNIPSAQVVYCGQHACCTFGPSCVHETTDG